MKLILTTVSLVALALFAGTAAAQTPDGETPAIELLCDEFNGAAFGLCNAYCEAMDCHLADDGDPSTEPQASAQACERVGGRFENLTGQRPPCADAVECSCFEPTNWNDPAVGQVWQSFAIDPEFFGSPVDCTEDGDSITIIFGEEGSAIGAGVDGTNLSCDVYSGSTSTPLVERAITAAEAVACRALMHCP